MTPTASPSDAPAPTDVTPARRQSRRVRLPASLAMAAVAFGVTGLTPAPAHAVQVPSIDVCKVAAPGSGITGAFTFTVSDATTTTTVQVPVGTCRQVVVGAVNHQGITVTEAAVSGTSVAGISVPYGTTLSSSLASRTVTVADDAYVFNTAQHVALSGEHGTVTFTNKAVSSGVACVVPPANMIAWYPFDETTGVTATNLRPPAPSAGLVNGPVHTPGAVAYGLQFDGVNDYAWAQGPGPNVGTGDFSIDFWVKTASSTGTQTIIDKRTGSVGNNLKGYAIAISNGKLLLQMADGPGFTNYPSTLSVADNVWHLVAVTVRRSASNGITFYVDAASQKVGNPLGRQGSLTSDGNLTFAKDTLNIVANFKGILDEVEIFNVELPAATVSSLWNAGSSGKCKPVMPLTPVR